MLAQSFKSATDLGIRDEWWSALCKTLVLLETGKLEHSLIDDGLLSFDSKFTGHFNMNTWRNVHSCGTCACIGGTAEMVGDVSFGKYWDHQDNLHPELYRLFYPGDHVTYRTVTPEQAAYALRSYLTTGSANWKTAVA